MIPKILHTAFFGDWKMTALNEKCARSWDRYCPADWRRMHWTRSHLPDNIPLNGRQWMERCWANPDKQAQSNAGAFLRHWLLWYYGGVIVDNDIQLLQPIDLSPQYFVGFQRDDEERDCINTSIMGSQGGHAFDVSCMEEILYTPPTVFPVQLGPGLLTRQLRARGMTGLNKAQMVEDITVYPKQVFYPWRWNETPDLLRIKPETVAIHWWEGSWAKR